MNFLGVRKNNIRGSNGGGSLATVLEKKKEVLAPRKA